MNIWHYLEFHVGLDTRMSVVVAFAAKRSTLLYLSEFGCGTALVHGLHTAFTHGSKKSHGHCDSHTPVNGIDLPIKLYGGSVSGHNR